MINQALDFIYGILKNDSVLVSNIARASDSDAKLPNKIDCLLDDSDIAKPYGRKFEDLCNIVDASSTKRTITKGYRGL